MSNVRALVRRVQDDGDTWLKEQADAIRAAYIASWLEAGRVLTVVRDRIKAGEFPSVDSPKSVHAWCEREFGWKKAQTYRLINGYGLFLQLKGESPMGDQIPAEHAIRPLFRLKAAEMQEQAWKRAEEIAGSPAFTQVEAKQAVSELMGEPVQKEQERPKVATVNDVKYVASGWIYELKQAKDLERLRSLRAQLTLAAKEALAAEEELANG